MTNITTRLLALAVIIVVIYGVAIKLRGTLRPPNVKLPDRDFQEMPLRFGEWKGEKAKLDSRVFDKIGAEIVVDRLYRNDAEHAISVHTALFADYDFSVSHHPIICYRGAGWELIGGREEELDLQAANQARVPIRLLHWKKDGNQVIAVYWYQLGKQVFFNRGGLGRARTPFLGKQTWPPLIKVLMQTSVTSDADEAKAQLQNLGEYVYKWINGPGPQPAADAPAK